VGSLAATVHHGLHCRRQPSDQRTTLPSGMVGTTMKKKKVPFMDVDFANYAVLLAEVLSVLV